METTNNELTLLLARAMTRGTPNATIEHQTMLDPMSPSVSRQSLIRRLVLHGNALSATFDRVTRLAARALHSSYALLDIVDGNWVYIKSATSPDIFSNGLRMADHSLSYSLDVVKDGVPWIIDDTAVHPIVANHPATRAFAVGAYLAVPLITSDDVILGTLAVMEHSPRVWTDSDVATLRDCVDIVREEIAAWEDVSRPHPNVLSADLLWHVGDQLTEGLLVTDETGRVLYVNQRMHEMSGYEPHELYEALLRGQLLHLEEDDESEVSPEELVSRFPYNTRRELRFQRKDKTPWWAEVSSFRILDGSAIVTLFNDRTRTKQLETMLNVSQKVECIGQLAVGTAHDFNNLLTIVLGSAQLAMSEVEEDTTIHNDLDEIFRAARRAAQLVRQILVFARNQHSDPQIVNLNVLLIDMTKMLRRAIGADVELVFLPQVENLFIEADPGQIEQIVFNLALNTCDMLPRGGKLVIETNQAIIEPDASQIAFGMRPGTYIQLEMHASSREPVESHVAHRFPPLVPAQDAEAILALRLATCYNIVRQYKGHLIQTHNKGEGERFSLYLPSIEEMPTVQDRFISIDQLPRGDETLLLVEDEPSVRFLATRFLRVCGYEVIEASNGDEALRLIEEGNIQNIHLVFTDMVMPQMGGKELVERLRARWPKIKVIITSGYSDTEESGYGAIGKDMTFLPKPFLPSTLASKVREVLDS